MFRLGCELRRTKDAFLAGCEEPIIGEGGQGYRTESPDRTAEEMTACQEVHALADRIHRHPRRQVEKRSRILCLGRLTAILHG